MLRRKRFEGLDALVAERGNALLATAILLTGSHAAGEDLLQTAVERLLRHWDRVHGDKEGYLRRTLYHLAVDRWRQRIRRPEVQAPLEPPPQSDGTDLLHLRQALVQALAVLPPRQRTVLVLRYWEQLTESETAEVLGCSIGTVKSTTSRGLSRLRELTNAWAVEDAHSSNGVGR